MVREFNVSEDFLTRLGPVGQEGFQALIGQWVIGQFLDHTRRRRNHVGTDACAVGDMVYAANRGSQDFGLEPVIVIDLTNIGYQVIPSTLISSSRPMKGEMKVAPALAARIA